MRAYLLSYDIADKKRLRKMHLLAKAHGTALQYSVFACLLRPSQRVQLASRIELLIDRTTDRVIIIDLGSIQDRETWIPPLEAFGRQLLADDNYPDRRATIILAGRSEVKRYAPLLRVGFSRPFALVGVSGGLRAARSEAELVSAERRR